MNPPPPPRRGGRWRAAPEAIVRRVRLPADLAAAPVELGWASRPDLEVNGGVALSAVIGRRIVTVAAVQDGIGSVRYPAGADAEMTRRAALALAGARDDGGAVGRRRP